MNATTSDKVTNEVNESAWAPLRSRVFLVVWTATLISGVGIWIREVGAGWLMTSLSPSTTHVALVQAATTLPIFLLSLPAGALADIVNRRKVLIGISITLMLLGMALALATHLNLVTPTLLLVSLFVAGMAAAVSAPLSQSLTPLLVPRSQLRSAIALNSLGFNISRAIGPAIAGVVISTLGVAANFAIDAVTASALLLAFLWWKGAGTPASSGPPERLIPAMRTGLRYATHSAPLRRTLLRAATFFLFSSALWALLPVLARRELGGGPQYYGLLLTCIGAGAVLGATLLPSLRRFIDSESLIRCGTALSVGVLLILALIRDKTLVAAAMGVAGVCWISVLTTANVSAQMALPNWVRGRGLAVYLSVFYGSLTLGSVVWGALADRSSLRTAFLCAAATGCVSLLIALRRPLSTQTPDLTPSMHWPTPPVSDAAQVSARMDRGPVMVTVEYQIDKANSKDFLDALRSFKDERLRDGAYQWGIFEDVSKPGTYVESFLVRSWAEHERQHQRISHEDARLQSQVDKFHKGSSAPEVKHFIAPP